MLRLLYRLQRLVWLVARNLRLLSNRLLRGDSPSSGGLLLLAGGCGAGPNHGPARITVNVPADAQLSVDGRKIESSSTERVFSSPDLKPGTKYYYVFTAEVVRDGKTLTAREVVTIEAGKNTTVSLNPASPAPALASR